MKYILEKKVEGKWWYDGCNDDKHISTLASNAFHLGKTSGIEDIKIVPVEDDFDVRAYKERLTAENLKG